MNGVFIGIVIGMVILAAVWAFYTVLQMIKEAKASIDKLAQVARELLAEGSFTQIASTLQYFRKHAPDWFAGMQEFGTLMTGVAKAAFQEDQVKEVARQPNPEESAFYPGVTDEQALNEEIKRVAAKQNITLSEDQLAVMRTEGQDQ